MPKLTVADYATMVGLSAQRINAYIKKGSLIRVNQLIDTEHPVNAQWFSDRVNSKHPKSGRPTADSPETISTEGIDAEDILERLANLDIKTLTKADLDKIHRLEQTLKIKVERQHKRGELIERVLIQTVFAKLFTIDTNELRTLGAKLAPEIAGMLNVEDPGTVLLVEQRIETEVMKVLAHIKRLFHEFLVKKGAEGLD